MKPIVRSFLLILFAHDEGLPAVAAETPESLRMKASAVLAQLEGEIQVPGLKEPVEILRGRWGIPHIYLRSVANRCSSRHASLRPSKALSYLSGGASLSPPRRGA